MYIDFQATYLFSFVMSYLGKGSESLALTSKLASGDYKYKHIIFNHVHHIHTLWVTVGDN